MEGPPRLGEAVDEEYRRPGVAGRYVVQRCAVDLGRVVGEAVLRDGGSGSCIDNHVVYFIDNLVVGQGGSTLSV